jgi:hypothetical protein
MLLRPMGASSNHTSNRRASKVALIAQLVIAIPVILLAGGYIFLELVAAIVFGVNKSANYAILCDIAKFPLPFIVLFPWALIAHQKGSYQQSAFVSLAAIGLFATILIFMSFRV